MILRKGQILKTTSNKLLEVNRIQKVPDNDDLITFQMISNDYTSIMFLSAFNKKYFS